MRSQLALGGFLTLASRGRAADVRMAPARGVLPARPGRGAERADHRRAALGVPDRGTGLLARAVHHGRASTGSGPRRWRTSPSWSSPTSTSCPRPAVAGHTDELATAGRVRQRLLERVAHHLLQGSPVDQVVAAAERADWEPPRTLTAVLVPESQVRPVLRAAGPRHPAGRRGTRARRRRAAARARRTRPPAPGAAARPRRPRRDRRAAPAVARGALVVRPGAARPGRRPARRHRGPPGRSWSSAPTRPPGRTCARRSSRRWPSCARRPPRSSPTRCARGCCTRAAATTSPPSCSCTRRRCATGWASCASGTATGSTTRPWCSPSRLRWGERPVLPRAGPRRPARRPTRG